MMKLVFSAALLFSGYNVLAQSNAIIGSVIDANSEVPIPNSNVFISNTSIGNLTSATGQFLLSGIVSGKSLELVVSCVGYETFTYNFSSEQLPLNVKIRLNKKVVELENVVIIPYEKNGWEKWGNIFLRNFLGESDNARDCEIENTGIIKFRHYKRENLLEASADGMLIIRNFHLGYLIKYQMEKFVFDIKNQRLSYAGYPLFLEMEPAQPLSPEYKRQRSRTYNGSVMHFMRSLYANKLTEEGFEVKRMKRITQIDTVWHDGKSTHNIYLMDSAGHKKPAPYWLKKKIIDKLDSVVLTKDSIVVKAKDQVSNILLFHDYLSVRYLSEKEPEWYRRYIRSATTNNFQQSVFFILNNENEIVIEPSGYYYPGLDLLIEGYLGSEKIGDLLPLDYAP